MTDTTSVFAVSSFDINDFSQFPIVDTLLKMVYVTFDSGRGF